MINKISDIIVGREYFICLLKVPSKSKKVKVIGIVNDTSYSEKRTEIVFEIYSGDSWLSTHIAYFKEIGIGEDRNECVQNYGKFEFEENLLFSDSSAEFNI